MMQTDIRSDTFVLSAFVIFLMAFSPLVAAEGNPKKDELQGRIADLESLVETQSKALEALQDMLACIDGSSTASNLILSGCNLHIRNATGSTNSANSLGNLIVGYNENPFSENRQGSHNIIVGAGQGYSGVSGLAVGTTAASLNVSDDKVSVVANSEVSIQTGLSILKLDTSEIDLDSKDIDLNATRTVTIKGSAGVQINAASF